MTEHQSTDDDNGGRVYDVDGFIDTTTYSLELPKVAAKFAAAGVHRTQRTLQRYCENGSIDARKYNTEKGSLWLASPESVDLKIKEIIDIEKTVSSATADTTPTADMSGSNTSHVSDGANDTTIDDDQRTSFAKDEENADRAGDRHSSTPNDDKYVTVPVAVLDALTGQLDEKDKQIARMQKASSEDRLMLEQAMKLIHGENFTPALEGEQEKPQPIEHPEIRSDQEDQDPDRAGDNQQASPETDSV